MRALLTPICLHVGGHPKAGWCTDRHDFSGAHPASASRRGYRGLAGLGAVPVRASVGHGARGLQRRRRRLGLLPARSRALAAYRWNEDGLAGICDDRQTFCFALALWNGARPDPQGAHVRASPAPEGNHGEDVKEYCGTSTRRRPTPGCAGATTIRRRAFPYDDLSTRTRRRGRDDARVRAARHRRLRRGPLLGRDRRLRQGRARRHLHPRSPSTNRGPERGDAARAADAVVPQHLVVGAAATGRVPTIAAPRAARARAPSTRRCGTPGARRRRRRRRLLFCDNETNVAAALGRSRAPARI